MEGKSAGDIALILHLSPNTVRSHIRRHPDIPGTRRCMTCGAYVGQPTGKRVKKFCSDACRMAWWNSHTDAINRKAYYTLVCEECGKEFVSYGNNRRKFCYRACYLTNRRKKHIWSYTDDSIPHLGGTHWKASQSRAFNPLRLQEGDRIIKQKIQHIFV